jgi:threonine synthase
MQYYSTNNKNLKVGLREAVIQGLASDNGLFMPEKLPYLNKDFFNSLPGKPLVEIAYEVSCAILGDDLPVEEIKKIVDHTIQFDAPVVQVEDNIYSLELFHGPTLAFKDFGARFMSQVLGYFAGKQEKEITILVATSGDTGSAVANGFLGVEGVRVIVLYPSGKVSDIQEKQFTTLGRNITALEVDGTFDDCQKLVKQAFLDTFLREKLSLTSANSINIARLIPQSFYYFGAYAQLAHQKKEIVFAVPSGNFGNLTAGIMAMKIGLPVKAFVAATNANDIVPEFLRTRSFLPRPSVSTISNAMDVGNPSNFARMLDLFSGDHQMMTQYIKGFAYSDGDTAAAIDKVYTETNYLMDPHGAIGYLGLKDYLRTSGDHNTTGIFLETAHPGKFLDVVQNSIGKDVPLPSALEHFQNRKKLSRKMSGDYASFREFLMTF